MKAWMVSVKFKDGSIEGVVFTDEDDANDALVGHQAGSSLARAFYDLYSEDDDPKRTKTEITI